MSEERPQFPDYGDNGDTAGVRRARRSFRLVVMSFVAITAMLWISEQFLRHEGAERTYITALTHERDSARVWLQQSIKEDRAAREKPTAKYTQALAVRSEHDVILRRYSDGILLDPGNALFRIRYGNRLFLMGHPGRAAEQFAEAGAQPQRNVLPLYLEAASIAEAREGSRKALSEALAKVATANSRSESVVFPRPLWTVEYEQRGYWYANLSREISDETCALLYRLSQVVTEDVSRQIDQNKFQHARTWMSEMMRMGERLVSESEPLGTTQGIAGLTIQLQALDVLDSLGVPMNGMTEEELIEKRLRLERALEHLQSFERERASRIEEQILKHTAPMWMVGFGLGGLIVVHVTSLFLYLAFRFKKSRWTVPHSTAGKSVLTGGTVSIFLLLWGVTLMQGATDIPYEAVRTAWLVWNVLLGGLVLFGLLYPALTLKSVEEVSGKASRLEDMEQTVRLARHTYRRAYASLSVRYYGILSGVATCTVCAWVIAYRILVGLYPWQFKLLASGLLTAEKEILRQAIGMLG